MPVNEITCSYKNRPSIIIEHFTSDNKIDNSSVFARNTTYYKDHNNLYTRSNTAQEEEKEKERTNCLPVRAMVAN